MKSTSIRLTDDRESALVETAARLKCFSSSGNPSWRVMLQMIADGFLTISNPNDKTRKVFINFKRPPGWWKPDEKGAMDAEDIAAKYKTTVAILEEKGFVVDGDRIYAGNWKGWNPAPAKEKAEKGAAADEEVRPPLPPPLAMDRPAWFTPFPTGLCAMDANEASKLSGYNFDEMKFMGMRVRKVSGQVLVSGPPGSEWEDRE